MAARRRRTLTARSWPTTGNPARSALGLTMPEHPYATDSQYATDPVFQMHRGGKIEIRPRPSRSPAATTSPWPTRPAVARVCTAIADQPELPTPTPGCANTVAVVSDGTAVLGLGDIGPAAAMPVMEGKALLFKHVRRRRRRADLPGLHRRRRTGGDGGALAPSFRRHQPGGHLGAALLRGGGPAARAAGHPGLPRRPARHRDRRRWPRCATRPGSPAGTLGDLRAVVAGAGASGIAVAKILLERGHRRRRGVRQQGHGLPGPGWPEPGQGRAGRDHQRRRADRLAPRPRCAGADVFIGLSGATRGSEPADRQRWPRTRIVFALSNPDPEIHPDAARAHARVVATGRSDFPNQINNVLAFPGVFRGALDVRAAQITEGMKLAAAHAIASLVSNDLAPDYVIPGPFDPRVAPAVAAAVAEQAREEGVARIRRLRRVGTRLCASTTCWTAPTLTRWPVSGRRPWASNAELGAAVPVCVADPARGRIPGDAAPAGPRAQAGQEPDAPRPARRRT